MTKRQQKIQISLVLTGLILIFITYFYYPYYINKMKSLEDKSVKEELEKTEDTDETTYFKDVKYKGFYDLDKPFTIQSEEAYMLNEKPNVIYMSNMHVILYLSDDRVVNITSNQGRYNKLTYDCFFETNVIATDGEIKISAENLDLLATENVAKIYNEVNLNYPTGSLSADNIDYNFNTKHFKVSMFDESTIKMKVIE